MNKKKKVAFLIYSLTAGGAERSCITTANLLAQRGHDVSIYLLCNNKDTIYKIDPHVKVHGTPPLRFGYIISSFLIYLEWLLLGKVPDVLISYMWAANFFAAWIARIFKLPVILSERCNPEIERQTFLPKTEEKAKKTFKYASKIVVLDDEIGNYMAQTFFIPQEKFITVFNSRDTVKCLDAKPSWLPEHYLLAVGRLCYQKGYERLIRIFSEVSKLFPDMTLIICGEGNLRNTLQEQIKALNMCDKIFLVGVKKNLPVIYFNAEVVLLTSHYEGLPGVLLESMMWGNCPVISFDTKYGPSNIITHNVNGLLIPQDDEEAFKEALIKYLKDPEMRKRFVKNIPETMKKFSPEVITDQWEKLIEEVTGESYERNNK